MPPTMGVNTCTLESMASYHYPPHTKASKTSGLDLCPPASPEFIGPRNEMPRPLMVIILKLNPFHISYLFLNVKLNLPHLDFDFSTLLPSKIGRNPCEM